MKKKKNKNSDACGIRTCDHLNLYLLMTVTVASYCAIMPFASHNIREDIIICYRLFSIVLFIEIYPQLINVPNMNLLLHHYFHKLSYHLITI